MDAVSMFNLIQSVNKPTQICEHILDWILHRRDDEILQTTHVSHELTSDHFIIIFDFDLLVPKQPPLFICKRNLCSVNNCSLVQDIKQCLNLSMTFTAEQLDSILRSLLDKHAPLTSCKISVKKFAFWYNTISDVLRTAKIRKQKAKPKDAGALLV